MIATTRHAGWSWDTTPEEAETMGTIVAQASRTIREVCDAKRVYMVRLGENSMHSIYCTYRASRPIRNGGSITRFTTPSTD